MSRNMGNVVTFIPKEIDGHEAELRRVRALPTERLKAIWDEYDGSQHNGVPPEYVLPEYVHWVLNERGEGDYCAV